MEKNNKPKQAVALQYSMGEKAPKVVAKGKNDIAERIINKAEEHDIPIHEDEKLAGVLQNIELGEYIPPELYEVVAEILVFVDDMDRIKSKIY